MARMFPKAVPRETSAAETQLFSVLATLPDEYHVFHSVRLRKHDQDDRFLDTRKPTLEISAQAALTELLCIQRVPMQRENGASTKPRWDEWAARLERAVPYGLQSSVRVGLLSPGRRAAVLQGSEITIGLDVGDRHAQVCVLDCRSGEVIEESRIRTTTSGIASYFASKSPTTVTLEVGQHSPWISRVLASAGHAVVVANARQVRLIHSSNRKNDRLDAEKLARLTRYDSRLLAPIQHRSAKAQADLGRVRSRDALVRSRTALVSHVRGSVKAFGKRLPSGSTEAFPRMAREHLPPELRPALEPVLSAIESITASIKQAEKELTALAVEYPTTPLLRQVRGVGLLTALTFQLVIEDPTRFTASREVGPYLGLTPGEHQSGERNPKRRITKEGDPLLRRLLVQCAHQILRSRYDSDLKRTAQRIMSKGGARSIAVTAVARKLAVLLHHLWVSGEVYEPLYNHKSDATTHITV